MEQHQFIHTKRSGASSTSVVHKTNCTTATLPPTPLGHWGRAWRWIDCQLLTVENHPKKTSVVRNHRFLNCVQIFYKFLNFPPKNIKIAIKRYLDGEVKFVASESGHIEKDPSKGVGHPRFSLSETSDEGFVALTWRPGHWREIAKAVPTMTRAEVFSGDGQTKVMITERGMK